MDDQPLGSSATEALWELVRETAMLNPQKKPQTPLPPRLKTSDELRHLRVELSDDEDSDDEDEANAAFQRDHLLELSEVDRRVRALMGLRLKSTVRDGLSWSGETGEIVRLPPHLRTRAHIVTVLRTLKLDGMRVDTLDEELLQLENLRELSVSNNDVPLLQNLPPSLEVLDAHNNLISDLTPPTVPDDWESVLHVGVGFNAINSLYAVDRKFPNLLSLDLGFNGLCGLCETLATLARLPQLTSVFLYGNPLCLIPHYRPFAVAALPKLAVLDDIPIREAERDAFMDTSSDEESSDEEVDEAGEGEAGSGADELSASEAEEEDDEAKADAKAESKSAESKREREQAKTLPRPISQASHASSVTRMYGAAAGANAAVRLYARKEEVIQLTLRIGELSNLMREWPPAEEADPELAEGSMEDGSLDQGSSVDDAADAEDSRSQSVSPSRRGSEAEPRSSRRELPALPPPTVYVEFQLPSLEPETTATREWTPLTDFALMQKLALVPTVELRDGLKFDPLQVRVFTQEYEWPPAPEGAAPELIIPSLSLADGSGPGSGSLDTSQQPSPRSSPRYSPSSPRSPRGGDDGFETDSTTASPSLRAKKQPPPTPPEPVLKHQLFAYGTLSLAPFLDAEQSEQPTVDADIPLTIASTFVAEEFRAREVVPTLHAHLSLKRLVVA